MDWTTGSAGTRLVVVVDSDWKTTESDDAHRQVPDVDRVWRIEEEDDLESKELVGVGSIAAVVVPLERFHRDEWVYSKPAVNLVSFRSSIPSNSFQ
jgi:hypothetical protein